MPWIVFYLIVIAGLRAVRLMRRQRAKRPRGLCVGCAFVHMQYGATGGNTVFCTFGGGVRPVKLDVLYCTDYRDRNVRMCPERIGFVPEVRGIEAEG
jgi:hypothetical protein